MTCLSTLGSQLGQIQPSTLQTFSIYSPSSTGTYIIRNIFITNTTSTATTFSLFFDDDGETYNTSTALFYQTPIDPNSTVLLDVFILMSNSAGNLAGSSGTAGAVTFTVFGEKA